jgi:hypothetical protein
MRKAKMVLSVVAAFAIVGGVAASKVIGKGNRALTTLYTHYSTDPVTKCTVPLQQWTITDSGPNRTLATFNSAQTCRIQFITVTQ